jgi:glycosyltransferase involved in cell wall biosynthesis
MKILCYMETPCISTGVGQLSQHLLPFLLEFGHEVEVCAINHYEGVEHNEEQYPFIIHRCPNDEAYNIEKAKELIQKGDYDLLFMSCDVGEINKLAQTIHEEKQKRSFQVLCYTCIDCSVIRPQVIAGLTLCDNVVMYSQHSVQVAIEQKLPLNIRSIAPGCEPDRFYPIDEEERRKHRQEIFNIDNRTCLFLNINRNQWRKDLGRTLMIFHEFYKRHTASLLYIHSKVMDVGGTLINMAGFLGMKTTQPGLEVMFSPPEYNEQQGFKRDFLNVLYNCADALISTTTGEGWGLCTTEAMAAGTPIILPGNTSALEIIGENEERGYLAKAGGDIDHMFIHYGVTDNPRDIVHAESMIEKMEHVYFHPEEAKEKAAAARAWAEEHTWELARKQWQALFAEIETKVETKEKVAV